MKTKSPKGSALGSVAVFDPAARLEFITGASKRKEQRRKEAQARALEKQKEERRLLRAQRREKIREHINYVQRTQRLAEAASAAVTSFHKQNKKSVGLDSRINSRKPKREGDAADKGWKASEAQPAQASEIVQAVHLLPPPANGASSSPWNIASCVSLSLGGFIEAPAEAGATTAAPATGPAETQLVLELFQRLPVPTSASPFCLSEAASYYEANRRV
ncbi:hypothetical protein, conserved [Eimeria brunetti]|uniref:Uncharacterized protein n=1 Tax=Eimeria brunetti TaxID=51314 RepID=U6LPJ1_9EIME|nr:hypothetical protein, conserved [Eimeria brunetti]